MKVAIEDIRIKERLRTDEGDLETLAQSIETMGLIQPIVISEEYELLSGYRRLHACKMLGWETIEVKLVTVGDDELKRLDWEYHENIGRKDLTPDEQQAYSSKREAMLHPTPTSFWSKVKAFFVKIFSIFKRK
jgi:ParB family chromosome partitioning protein